MRLLIHFSFFDMLFRFGKLGNKFMLLKNSLPPDVSLIIVRNQDNVLISNVKVEISNGEKKFSSFTNEKGEAKLRGNYGELYELILSAENIETKIINDWIFEQNFEVYVEEKPFLNVKPKLIYLCPGNKYTEDVNVFSNVDWLIQ